MKISGKQLRRLIKEELGLGAQKGGAGLPAANDMSKKLSSAGPEEAMDWLARVLRNMNFGASSAPEAPVPEEVEPPAPRTDEEV
jgi:hypothetical protein